jgi:hypothetical protein
MEQDASPRLIDFRRLTLRSATGTPQRGGPCHFPQKHASVVGRGIALGCPRPGGRNE